MSIARPHTGDVPLQPVHVVPEDPTRHGALIRVRGWEIAVADPVRAFTDMAGVQAAADEIGWDADDVDAGDGPPLHAGLVGFMTDDLSARAVDLPRVDVRPGPAPLPPLWFGAYDHVAARSPEGRWWVAGLDETAVARAEALISAGAQRPRRRFRGRTSSEPVTAWTSIDYRAHAAAVERIKGWIAAGDVYQVNLTMLVRSEWERSPGALATALFGASSGASHAAYLHAPGATIASVSPETFLRTDGRRAQIRPIKGTRPRGSSAALDRMMAEDLRASSKDSAEHVMIVDLERNDLGQVCEVGSVRVSELMTLEEHPTVWHLTSTVEGQVHPSITLTGLLEATFPCGSITGAPKRMAVDRIRRLEPWRRGVYCGAIGVIGTGIVDLSVAIRTAVVRDGFAWYGTGGGIVADSDPLAEWDEAKAKAAPFLFATNTTWPVVT